MLESSNGIPNSKLVFALTALHNFIRYHEHGDKFEQEELEAELSRGEDSTMQDTAPGDEDNDKEMDQFIERIARLMWQEYQKYTGSKGVNLESPGDI